MAPNVAVRLSRFNTIALIGMTTLPNIMNSSTAVMTAISPSATGSRENSVSFTSTRPADCPVTSIGAGASVSRTACTRSSPSGENGSTAGTTDRYVPPSADRNPAYRGALSGVSTSWPGSQPNSVATPSPQ